MPSFQKPQLGSVKAKILLVGSFGSGKTYGALTFPRPAVIDAEGSVDLYGDEFDFVSLPTKSVQDAMDAVSQVTRGRVEVGGKPCETLVLDSLSSFYDTIQFAMMGDSGDIDQQKWGLIKRQYGEFIDTLYHKVNIHVVATARVKPLFVQKGKENAKVPEGAFLVDGEIIDCDKKVGYAFDLVFKLSVDEKGNRKARVMKSRGIFSADLPHGKVIDGGFSWALIEPILAKYKDGAERQTGNTSGEAAKQDLTMMTAPDRSAVLKAAGEACKAHTGATSAEMLLGFMASAITEQFGLDNPPQKFNDMNVEQLTWAAEHFTKLRESAVA
jgi:hypothetical protein